MKLYVLWCCLFSLLSLNTYQPAVLPTAQTSRAVRSADVIIYGGTSAAITALYNSFAPGTRLSGSLKWKTIQQNDFGILLILIAVQTDQHHTCRFKPKTPSCQ